MMAASAASTAPAAPSLPVWLEPPALLTPKETALGLRLSTPGRAC